MRTAGPKVAIALCVTLTAAVSLAQSLGDVARQERERRSELTQHARVITNDDLKREHILSAPPEEASVASANTTLPAIATPAAAHAVPLVSTEVPANVPLWGVAEQPGFSLGAYARALRRERRLREAENAKVRVPAQQVAQNAPAQPVANATQAWQHPQTVSRNQTLVINPRPPLVRAVRGDSLWRLARVHLGEGRLWPLLWEANPELRHPGRLTIGQLLRVPARNLNFAGLGSGRKLASIQRQMEGRARGAQLIHGREDGSRAARAARQENVVSGPSRRPAEYENSSPLQRAKESRGRIRPA